MKYKATSDGMGLMKCNLYTFLHDTKGAVSFTDYFHVQYVP